ncbi:MAG: hypothetical protein ABI318_24505 [Chthoniobacteraceae bacterium]
MAKLEFALRIPRGAGVGLWLAEATGKEAPSHPAENNLSKNLGKAGWTGTFENHDASA